MAEYTTQVGKNYQSGEDCHCFCHYIAMRHVLPCCDQSTLLYDPSIQNAEVKRDAEEFDARVRGKQSD